MKRCVLFLFGLALVSMVSPAVAKPVAEIVQLRELADSLHSVGQTDSAAVVGECAVRLAKESGDLTQIVGTNAAQGVFLRSLGRIDEALESYNAALEIVTSGKFRENPDQEAIEEIASLYINLAVLNLDMQQKEEAAKNAELSGAWIAKSDDAQLKSTIFGVVGSVLTGCGFLDKALKYQELAYKSALVSGDEETAFRAAAYTMLISDRMGEKLQAKLWRDKCGELLTAIQSTMAKLVYYQAECSICLKNNDQKGSLIWFDKILNLDGIDNLPFVKFDCYNNMHMAYAAIQDYDDAYLTLLKSNEIRDSLWEQEKSESLRDLMVKYETKETELALAQSEAKRTKTLMWLFASAGILLVVIIFFVIYANRQRRRRMEKEMEFVNLRADIGRQLTEQYIEGLEGERQRMARELHDGVCNDLLAVQMRLPDEQAAMLNDCRESVRRISHELMPPEFAYADLDEVVCYYINKQRDAYRGKVEVEYISTSGGWESISDSDALEIYRIVQESVGNALKHSGATLVKVAMTIEESCLRLEVSDNGVCKSSGRRGIGLGSMRRRASAIGGVLDFRNDDNGSTSLVLTVKIGQKP